MESGKLCEEDQSIVAGADRISANQFLFFRLRTAVVLFSPLQGLFSPAIIRWTRRCRAAMFSRGSSILLWWRAAMLRLDSEKCQVVGPYGTLDLPDHDEVTRKLAMLIAGECLGLGPLEAAKAFAYSKQRYFQLRNAFAEQGAAALVNRTSGPGRLYRCTDEAVRQAIRQRFLDPAASPEVIAQRLTQSGLPICARSVERIIERFGLQKKTTPLQADP